MEEARALKLGLVIVAIGGTAFGTGAQVRGQAQGQPTFNWASHNLDLRNSRYAPIDDINNGNVGSLVAKWTYNPSAADNISRNTPLVIDGIMYFNAGSKLFALDAATGKQLWVIAVDSPFPASGRGVTYGDGRIYAHGQTVLYAVDAKSGAPVESFGNRGRLTVPAAALAATYGNKDAAGYSMTSPAAYHDGTLYLGLALSE